MNSNNAKWETALAEIGAVTVDGGKQVILCMCECIQVSVCVYNMYVKNYIVKLCRFQQMMFLIM